MSVCNIFNSLNSSTGNFMLFSQYVEDITHNYPEGDNWKIIPTQFVALDIDYSKVDPNMVLNKGKDSLNVGIPKYFQNCFENACAYGRKNYSKWIAEVEGNTMKSWTPEISRNLFWNYMFDGELITSERYGSESSDVRYIPQVMYYGDINMHSYNEHKGMGYGEIYCYIPTNAEQMCCQVVRAIDSDIEGRKYDSSNNSIFLEGHKDRYVEDYTQHYFYNRDFSMSFDDEDISSLANTNNTKYNINTIVVLYSIFRKFNDNWEVLYSNIPMGMYITGRFDDNGKLTNEVTKYVTTNYDTGTSYGLRICTRFTATSNGAILSNSDITTDDSGYTNVCQLMTAMNENLSRMLDVSKSALNTTQQYKDLLSMIKNNRTNVPYVKDVNGVDCWFVNGRFVSAVNRGIEMSCIEVLPETVEKRIENLLDSDHNNDYTKIEDGRMDCDEIKIRELAEYLKLNPEDYPEFGTTIVEECKHEVAEELDIINAFYANDEYPNFDDVSVIPSFCRQEVADDKEVINALYANDECPNFDDVSVIPSFCRQEVADDESVWDAFGLDESDKCPSDCEIYNPKLNKDNTDENN